MKKFLFILLILVSFLCNAQLTERIFIPIDYVEYSLEKFLIEISKTNRLNFYYKPAWISDVKISFKSDSIYIKKFLDNIEQLGELDYYASKS